MPIGLGLASSHAPSLVAPLEQWKPLYQRFSQRVPQPPEAAQETPAVIEDYIARIDRAFGTLRERLAAYRPDVLIIIGGDQSEMFDRSNVPNLMIYVGSEAWAAWTPAGAPGDAEEDLKLNVDVETSRLLLDKLVREEEFDV